MARLNHASGALKSSGSILKSWCRRVLKTPSAASQMQTRRESEWLNSPTRDVNVKICGDRYLQLLDWTGRELRSDKRGSIPKDLDPMLERLQCSRETWLDLVRNFRKRVRGEIGLRTTLQSVSSRRTNRTAAQA